MELDDIMSFPAMADPEYLYVVNLIFFICDIKKSRVTNEMKTPFCISDIYIIRVVYHMFCLPAFYHILTLPESESS